VVAQGSPDAVIDAQFLAAVYGVTATIVPNPASGRPMIAYGP
jgi:iron complex transport system ATP-binding protein